MADVAEKLWTVADFLNWEAAQPAKYELINGRVVAMVRGTSNHARIIANLLAGLHHLLRGTPCEAFTEGLQVRLPGLVAYPDIIVTCKDPDPASHESRHPRILIEVLSPSTENIDRGAKWQAYQAIPSLEYFVLVAQDRPHVELFTRRGDDWLPATLSTLDAELRLATVGVELALREIYERCFR